MDEKNLFSSQFTSVSLSSVKSEVQSEIADIQKRLDISNADILEYQEYYAVRVIVDVNLPSRGPVNGVDIRRKEPLLILFHKIDFPGKAPQMRSDRRDFPHEKLPHLNLVFPNAPYSLCLHRGSIDDWYAERTGYDLVYRAINWLEDAARNKLIKEWDAFEPTRIDFTNWVGGISVFQHKYFSKWIEEKWLENLESSFSFVASYGTLAEKNTSWFYIKSGFLSDNFEDVLEFYKSENMLAKGAPLPGILLWPRSDYTCSEYFGALPKTSDELYSFSDILGINLRETLENNLLLNKSETKKTNFVPVFICVPRPQKLINSETNLEVLSFLLGVNENDCVHSLPPREPLTPSFSRMLSQQELLDENSELFIVGCGALGSKISLHLGRAGITNLTLVDSDSLSPHNLVRHGLLADSIGKNKAVAITDAIQKIYWDVTEPIKVTAHSTNIFSLVNKDQEIFKKANFIVDATASLSVFDRLAFHSDPYQIPIIRCEIADQGKLGITLVEGRGRSPRLDDLQASLYDLALDDSMVQRWLEADILKGGEPIAELEDITVGLGCSSPTMKLSDDTISFHASLQSTLIRKLLSDEEHVAGIQLSNIESDTSIQVSSKFIEVSKYRTLHSRETQGWTIRIQNNLYDLMIQQTVGEVPNETGGILIGHINVKHKTVHITRQLPPPEDSEGMPYAFRMGVKNVSKKIKEIMKKTRGQITYLGEWHSHPTGSSRLSPTDHDARKQLLEYFSRIQRPTIIMIVTPKGCYPHVSFY